MKYRYSLSIAILIGFILDTESVAFGGSSNSQKLLLEDQFPVQLKKIVYEVNKSLGKRDLNVSTGGTKDDKVKSPLSSQHQDFVDKMKGSHSNMISGWEKGHAATIKKWAKEHRIFSDNISNYKSGLISFGFLKEKKIKANKVSKKVKTLVVSKESFSIPMRNQLYRGTCAAFVGIRAIEILLERKGNHQNLSEQYFYWASRPKCHKIPCSNSGSWVTTVFGQSSKGNAFDIPTESSCPYVANKDLKNVTYSPLSKTCLNSGRVKVEEYSFATTPDEIVSSLDSGHLVVGAFRLDDAFYKTKGFVQATSSSNKIRNSHKKGHALLITGYMRLPEGSKGDLCYIVNNSWGEGWGAGGHACISESWFNKMRFKVPFVVLEEVK